MMFLLVIQKLLCQVNVKKDKKLLNENEALERKQKEEGLWTMYFDGSVAKVGVGAKVSAGAVPLLDILKIFLTS